MQAGEGFVCRAPIGPKSKLRQRSYLPGKEKAMSHKKKESKSDHQIFDGGRPEFRNINERIFSALETDYDGGYTWDPEMDSQHSAQQSQNLMDPIHEDREDDPTAEFDY